MKCVVLTVVLVLATAGARVVVVPDSAPTVQAGLNLAGAGDTVLVKPGRYVENITWPARDGIRLYSFAGPDVTAIDAAGSGRVMHVGNVTRATEIRGFTITGGMMTSGAGAGIYVTGSPVISGNVIRDNRAQGSRNYGGGIYTLGSPIITGNIIRGNVVADTNTWNYGGGIHVAGGTAEICFNVIDSNRAAQGYWNYGAGVYISSSSRALVYQNVIRGNENTLGDRGHGAGVYANGPALVFANLVIGNRNASGSWNYGGGIMANAPRVEVFSNTITANSCVGGTWRDGGGIYVYMPTCTALVKNNIIAGNSAGAGGGIYRYDHASAVLLNSFNDVWNNTGGNYTNCSPGPGDISQDPLFVAGARGGFYLAQVAAGQPQNSPCVNAGDTVVGAWPVNLDSMLLSWTTRTDSVRDAAPIDIGHHYPVGIMLGVAGPSGTAPPSCVVGPNPFRAGVVMRFDQAGVTVSIYDAIGRHVRTVRGTENQPPAWDGCDALGRPVAPGAYIWRAVAEGSSVSGRLVRAP